jgi:hypothetical protein
MGEIGRQHVLSNFTWRHSAIKFHDFCEQWPMRAEATELKSAMMRNQVPGRGRRWLTRSANLAGLLRRREVGNAFLLIGNFLQRRGL